MNEIRVFIICLIMNCLTPVGFPRFSPFVNDVSLLYTFASNILNQIENEENYYGMDSHLAIARSTKAY